MIAVLRCKTDVKFTRIRPGGFRLLSALERTARTMGHDLTITSGAEAHAATNPHTRGEAYDVRTHDLTPEQKVQLLVLTMSDLKDDASEVIQEVSGGLATARFFGFLEAADTPNEHAHFQRRRGRTYP